MSRKNEFESGHGLTPVNLDSDGGGETVVKGSPETRRTFEGPVTDPSKDKGLETSGAKRQPDSVVVSGPRPTRASKAADNASPLKVPVMGPGGRVEGVTVAEREEISRPERAEAQRVSENAVGLTAGPRSGSGKELEWGALAKADRTIPKAFKEHMRNWRRRQRLGMGQQHGVTAAAAKVEAERIGREDHDGPMEHPAFQNDVTYHQVAAALSSDVGMVNDHNNLDEEGRPTPRALNADDLKDFARFHRHIFGHSQTVDDVDHEGRTATFRVDPAAFSMFHLVGKHQRRGDGAQVPQIHVDGAKQDAYHWIVGALKKHVDTNASANRRSVTLDQRRERREDVKAQQRSSTWIDEKTGKPALSQTKIPTAPVGPASASVPDITEGITEPRAAKTKYGRGARGSLQTRHVVNPDSAPLLDDKGSASIAAFPTGSSVKHSEYGEGKVVSHGSRHSMVDFGELNPIDRTPVLRRVPHTHRVTPHDGS